jgi:hypothetical protein
MTDCGVCIGGGDYDGTPEFCNVEYPKARKVHRCTECRMDIPKGVQYQRVSGKCDGDIFTEKTCCPCAEIRDAFTCDGVPPEYGKLWEEMESSFPTLTTGCLESLETPEAKRFLLDRWRKWKGLAA